jgi:hypothetical protein
MDGGESIMNLHLSLMGFIKILIKLSTQTIFQQHILNMLDSNITKTKIMMTFLVKTMRYDRYGGPTITLSVSPMNLS